MYNIVIGCLFVVLALMFVLDVARVRRQSFGKALAKVERELARPRPPGEPSLVTVWSAYPLSDQMVKRLAERGGFRFVGERKAYNGARALAFDPPRTSRKLSLHD